jgi:hypothetical protein
MDKKTKCGKFVAAADWGRQIREFLAGPGLTYDVCTEYGPPPLSKALEQFT